MQEAFLQAFQALGSFEENAQLATWLHRIVVNACLMRLRSRKRKPEESIEPLLPVFDELGNRTSPVEDPPPSGAPGAADSPGSRDAEGVRVNNPLLTCREVVEFLWRYEENELSPAEREAFDAHLSDCPCCGAYLETYRATVALEHAAFADLEAWVPETVPEELVTGILAARRANG